jgi:hypothetical protein
MMDAALLELFPDTITIEPFSSMSSSQVVTYGTAVTYQAQVTSEWSKSISGSGRGKSISGLGRELSASVRVIIPDRVHIDPRDRVTLPSGWVPNQPPILSVRPIGGVVGMAMDSTEITL